MIKTASVEKGLVKKIFWTYNVKDIWHSEIQSLANCQKLEEEGFGMLEDKKNSGRVDDSDSVVCPDGSVFTSEQIDDYWNNKKDGSYYSSQNPKDVMMHKARMYLLGFRA
jgi:hypothetical protein